MTFAIEGGVLECFFLQKLFCFKTIYNHPVSAKTCFSHSLNFILYVCMCEYGSERWSEKPQSLKSKNGQADYLPRHSPDARTVFEI